jgi:Uncharacterized protein conserved in bacteria
MRSVRCDLCGTKALMAASQCPKCGHLFELRDTWGELPRLSYCPTCETYYPESLGSCRWCGTMPAPPPNIPLIWKRIGIAGLVVILGLGLLLRGHDDTPPAHTQAATQPRAEVTPAGDTLQPSTSRDTIASVTQITPAETASPRVTTLSAGNVEPNPPAAGSSTNNAKSSSRWVVAIAKSWVIVRADARRDARIVASLGPNSRVQLGEARGSWRRLRSRGIAGWVDGDRSSFAARNGAKHGGWSTR